ncbi:AAA family ATPase [Persicobacter sp. CCB-QB2]|uniref:AAA family ATPase n=1 Tax=Persicobacter sp. CCB-QB2 TaxID=1561025 RepID=UPI0006A98D59|nr:AAA family ATPase [Persicobacter sp. CCB-QB2]
MKNIQITDEYRKKVLAAILEDRERFDGTDTDYARRIGVNNSVFSSLKKGEIEGKLASEKWLSIGKILDVHLGQRNWKAVRTEVFEQIQEDVDYCQLHSRSMLFVDDCAIGKTFAAKYLSRSRRNCFYMDASQCKRKISFIRTMARTLGLESTGRVDDVKQTVKYYLSSYLGGMEDKPLIIIDEAGDLEYSAFLELKELWNATEHRCGWYMIGADGLRRKITRGIDAEKVGFREIFSRFGNSYSKAVPVGKEAQQAFYKKLIADVVKANATDKKVVNEIVRRCLSHNDNRGGLRRAEDLLILLDQKDVQGHENQSAV